MKLNSYIKSSAGLALDALRAAESQARRDLERSAIAKLLRKNKRLNGAMRRYEGAKTVLRESSKLLRSAGLQEQGWGDEAHLGIDDDAAFRKAGGELPTDVRRVPSPRTFLRDLAAATPEHGRRMLEKIGVLWE